MKKKSLVVLLMVVLAMMMTAACSKTKPAASDGSTKAEATEENKEEVDPAAKETEEILGWLDDSAKAFSEAKVYEESSEGTTEMDDGTTSENINKTIYDKEQEVVEQLNQYGADQLMSRDWVVKDGNSYYEIHEDNLYTDETATTIKETKYFRLPVEESRVSYVEDYLMAKDYSFYKETEWYAYEDFVCKQVGEDEINGTKVIKAQVTYNRISKAQEPSTREEFLADMNVTEEEVSAIDGCSEALDAYLDALNKYYSKEYKTEFTEEYYFRADNHRLFARQEIYDRAETDKEKENASEEEKEIATTGDAFYNLLSGSSDTSDVPQTIRSTSTICYYVNEECDAMDPVPTDYADAASYEDYYNNIQQW